MPNENVWDGPPISDPIDFRVYLTAAQFKERVLKSVSWRREYLQLPPIESFDEAAALAEIEERNATRAANRLPLLNMEHEIARQKEHYESKSFADRFYALASECIIEIYGSLTPKDFNSLSAMRGFFADRQNVIHALIQKQSGSGRRR